MVVRQLNGDVVYICPLQHSLLLHLVPFLIRPPPVESKEHKTAVSVFL
jgi:hypothetical protein